MRLISYIEKVFNGLNNGSFKCIYIMVDVHNTILKSTFDKKETFEYFPYAKETLQLLSEKENIKLIMWTSSYDEKIQMYLKHFEENGIIFNFVNENKEYGNVSFACFDTKFYYDIGIDDKFGFDAEHDWKEIYTFLTKKLNFLR